MASETAQFLGFFHRRRYTAERVALTEAAAARYGDVASDDDDDQQDDEQEENEVSEQRWDGETRFVAVEDNTVLPRGNGWSVEEEGPAFADEGEALLDVARLMLGARGGPGGWGAGQKAGRLDVVARWVCPKRSVSK